MVKSYGPTGAPLLFLKDKWGGLVFPKDDVQHGVMGAPHKECGYDTDKTGKWVLFEDLDGNLVMPVDWKGKPYEPFSENGRPVLSVDALGVLLLTTNPSTGKVINPEYLDGQKVFKEDSMGDLILPIDQFGRLIPTKNEKGELLTELIGTEGRKVADLWKQNLQQRPSDDFFMYPTGKDGSIKISDRITTDNYGSPLP